MASKNVRPRKVREVLLVLEAIERARGLALGEDWRSTLVLLVVAVMDGKVIWPDLLSSPTVDEIERAVRIFHETVVDIDGIIRHRPDLARGVDAQFDLARPRVDGNVR